MANREHPRNSRCSNESPQARRQAIVETTPLGWFISRTLLLVVFLLMLTSITSSAVNAAKPSFVSAVAEYAFSTASHEKPARAVSATDLSNAVATKSNVTTLTVTLGVNLGDIPSYPRLAIFIDSATFKNICVHFSNVVGKRPYLIACPQMAIALWQEAPSVMEVSRNAVAMAAAKGRAVSGADVAKSFTKSRFHFVTTPAFKTGQGGKVTFVSRLKMTSDSGSVTENVHVCVKFPTTEAGIPFQVHC
jgi:hypothetical protein